MSYVPLSGRMQDGAKSVEGRTKKSMYSIYINVNRCQKGSFELPRLFYTQTRFFFQEDLSHSKHRYWFLHDNIRMMDTLNRTLLLGLDYLFIITNIDPPTDLDQIKNHCVIVNLV